MPFFNRLVDSDYIEDLLNKIGFACCIVPGAVPLQVFFFQGTRVIVGVVDPLFVFLELGAWGSMPMRRLMKS